MVDGVVAVRGTVRPNDDTTNEYLYSYMKACGRRSSSRNQALNNFSGQKYNFRQCAVNVIRESRIHN